MSLKLGSMKVYSSAFGQRGRIRSEMQVMEKIFHRHWNGPDIGRTRGSSHCFASILTRHYQEASFTG